ncbi:hypothetical protein [Variovorax gossypii]|jgi:hypothetical protein
MNMKYTSRPVAVESEGRHRSSIGTATVENSALLRGFERRKVERAAMRAALAQASEFTALVESMLTGPVDPKHGDGPEAASQSTVLKAMAALRASIAALDGGTAS